MPESSPPAYPPDETLSFPEPRAEEVRKSIVAAFEGLQPPEESALIAPRHANAPKIPEIRRVFGGKRWSDLDFASAKGNWSFHCYFTPEGWRYYLPALLIRSLDPRTDFSFVHSVVFHLRPDWHRLYVSCDDRIPEQDGVLLDEAQQGAVAAYLHLLVDGEGRLKWSSPKASGDGWEADHYRRRETQLKWGAAEALRWRWNRVDTMGLRAAEAAFAARDAEEAPRPRDRKAQRIAELVRRAFARTPPPDPTDMVDSFLSDEPLEYGVQFRGRDWRKLPASMLDSTALCFFSTAAFRYFLPAFLIADLSDSSSGADPVFILTNRLPPPPEPGDRVDARGYSENRFSTFDRGERAAIVAYLEHEAKAGTLLRQEIAAALENYWRPSLDASERR